MLTKDDFPAVTVEERRFLRNFATTDQIVEWAQQYAAKAIAAHTAKVLEDVEPVAWGIFAMNGNIRFWSCDKASADAQAAKTGGEVVGIYPAHTVAALAARVAELEKDAGDEFTQGIDAAAKMLDKMADDYSRAHAVQDPDTGVYEFGRGAKEDYYNTLRELADDVRSIVYAPGERENTAQTLKAAKDAAFEQAANLLECEYAEDAKQKRRLDQIAQHIRDLKKRSS